MYCWKDGPDVQVSEIKPKSMENVITIPEIPPYPTGTTGTYIWDIVDGKLVWVLYTPPEIPVVPPDPVTVLQAQVKAQTESNTFLEDCIAEMAMQVYK